MLVFSCVSVCLNSFCRSVPGGYPSVDGGFDDGVIVAHLFGIDVDIDFCVLIWGAGIGGFDEP